MKYKTRVESVGAMGIALGLTVVACASAPRLDTDASASSIRGAQEVGAEQVPVAALHLKLAKDQLASAKRLSEKGDAEEADSMLTRAEADAQLAILLSRESSEKSDARVAENRVKNLKRENQKFTEHGKQNSESGL